MTTQILPQVLGGTPIFTYEELIAAGVPVPEFIEPDLFEDYCFDLDVATSFRSRINARKLNVTGKALTLVKDDVQGKYLSIGLGHNGIPTNLEDAIGVSWGGIFQWNNGPAGAFQMFGGSGDESSAQGGEVLFKRDSGSLTLAVRSSVAINVQFTASEITAMGIVDGSWFLPVVTSKWVDQDAGTSQHNLYIATEAGVFPRSGVGIKTPATPARNFAIGNPGLETAHYDDIAINCARFFTAERTMSQDEIADLYPRAKIVAERRGIPLV